jgi:hypothetical protein
MDFSYPEKYNNELIGETLINVTVSHFQHGVERKLSSGAV